MEALAMRCWTSALLEATSISNELVMTCLKVLGLANPPDSPVVLTPAGSSDLLISFIFACAFFVFNWGSRLLVIEPFARVLLKPREEAMRKVMADERIRLTQMREKLEGDKGNKRLKQRVEALGARVAESFEARQVGEKQKAVQKYAQAATEAIFYGSFALVGLAIVPSQPFFWPSANWWVNFSTGEHSYMRQDLRCYYIMYASRYMQAIVSVLMEHKRKDFVEMQVHHIVTVTLVGLSYYGGWNRVGVIVMVLLDPADVPLHVAKLCKYTCDYGGSKMWQTMADRFFELFALVFFVTRICMYPYVCWSSHFEAARYFEYDAAAWTCVALLEILLVLQCYWFTLLLKAVINMLTKGGVEDIRSDDEDDDKAKGTGRDKLTCSDTPE